jgi:hypothetical protein
MIFMKSVAHFPDSAAGGLRNRPYDRGFYSKVRGNCLGTQIASKNDYQHVPWTGDEMRGGEICKGA